MTTTMEQMVIQLQQELFTLKAQVVARVQIASAAQARLLTTAQARKDAPSLINTNDSGCPKEFSGKEEDLQQWSKETKAFFAGVIKESEMMLEWAAEQTTEISTEFIDPEFLPIMTNQKREVQNLEFILQQMHTMLTDLTIGEANDIVANSRKNPLESWRRLQKRYHPTYNRREERLSTIVIPRGRRSDTKSETTEGETRQLRAV